jgi:hypothetical protein
MKTLDVLAIRIKFLYVAVHDDIYEDGEEVIRPRCIVVSFCPSEI